MTLSRMYILTDSTGFTTCCDATWEAADKEVARRPMLMPITVHHWMIKNRDWFHVFTARYRPRP